MDIRKFREVFQRVEGCIAPYKYRWLDLCSKFVYPYLGFMNRIWYVLNCSWYDFLKPIVKFQCALHAENTCHGRLNSGQIQRFNQTININPEFGNVANSTCCSGTFICHSKNTVAGNLSTSRIKVTRMDFAGSKAFLKASDGTIDGFVSKPL